MGKRTREIVALVLLALLGLVVLAAMVWYLVIGHNWNVAATSIDESVGSMEGYTVILFEGEVLPESERTALSNGQPLLDDQNRGVQPVRSGREPQAEPVSMHEAASYYRQMGATVFLLHPEAPETYEDPIVLNKNGVWLGIFYADGSTSRIRAQYLAASLQTRGIDFAIMIVDDARMVNDPISSADIVICTADEGLSSRGEVRENSFCVQSPLVGQVQTVIISPSNVISSKAITWL